MYMGSNSLIAHKYKISKPLITAKKRESNIVPLQNTSSLCTDDSALTINENGDLKKPLMQALAKPRA